jgi:aromatic ring hydroxylase
MVELLRQIGGSDVVMQPSEKGLANADFRPFLDKYMRGKDVGVEYKSRLYRLAHDLAASSFAMRQEIYEYWHGGDPNRNRVNLYRGHDQSGITDRIKDMIAQPLPYTD